MSEAAMRIERKGMRTVPGESFKLAMLIAMSVALVGVTAAEVRAEADIDCELEGHMSDVSGQIGTDRLAELNARAGRLSRQYDVGTFFCLSDAEITTPLADHLHAVAESLFASRPGGEDRVLVYVNTARRQMSFHADGPVWNVWRDALMPSLRKSMRGPLAADSWAEAFEAAAIGLEADIYTPMRSADPDDAAPVSAFSMNVARHVLAHEMAHALIREFRLPVLANEEAMADSFATSWILTTRKADGPAIVMDRVRSWLLEDSEVLREDYDFKGEHLLDIRRAYQAACLLYGSSPKDHLARIEWLGFSERDLRDCADTAPDQFRGWAAVIEQHALPEGKASENVVLIVADDIEDRTVQGLSGLVDAALSDLRRFDWPEPVSLHIENCPRTAWWSRSSRTITLCVSYIHRFWRQGMRLEGNEQVMHELGKR
ncbi:MAG: DUF4344 domain-containing metallopeptidase [Boseongicola sp.]|nr:DUF4344 domain-containing metallopeptidase [Boseongicola sp.]